MDKNKKFCDVLLERYMKMKIRTPENVRFEIVCYDRFNEYVFEINKGAKDVLDTIYVMFELKRKYENKKTNTVPVFHVYCYETKSNLCFYDYWQSIIDVDAISDETARFLAEEIADSVNKAYEMQSTKIYLLSHKPRIEMVADNCVRISLNLPESPYTPEKNEKK